MRYDILRGWFRTPNGKSVLVYWREGTNDYNTARASLDEDEYGLRGRKVEGLCLDVGGYLGTVSLGLLIDNPKARVIVVEPVPDNADLIERNAVVNGVADRLELVRGAVGVSGSDVTVRYRYEGDEMELHHAFVGNATNVSDHVPHQEVTYRAHDIRDLVGDAEVTLCKIDCEGGEWPFLATPGLEQLREIVGEWHPTALPDRSIGSRDALGRLLGDTHVLTFTGPEAGPGGFVAVRR